MTDAPTPYDVIVIGGGVNGAGIARDAAGRGARVQRRDLLLGPIQRDSVAPPGGTIVGAVMDSGGIPVPDARVRMSRRRESAVALPR